MQDWFRNWFNSPYYYQLYANRNEKEASEFIHTLIHYLKPNQGAKMLDAACGKGRHSIQLAEMGYDVTGIDLSENSISEAKKSENANLEFYVHDMRLPFRINFFDYVFNFFTSFGYFQSQRENDAVIRTMASALKPNGFLIIDYLNVHYAKRHIEPDYKKKVGDINFKVSKWQDDTHFYKKIIVEDPHAGAPLIYSEKVAKFSLGDFTDMLAYRGLQIKEIFGDYQLNPYSLYQSPRLILLAEKIRISN
ncbi:MAG: class I SAM-dependent methyltransferase [Ferruginibacter sp.]|nr:class I SAM-dependent methyltransferase [Ferruginibacter sp.]